MSEFEYLKDLADEISDRALDGNWTLDSIGDLQEMDNDIKLLKDAVGVLCAILTNNRVISLPQLKGLLKNGWRIREEP
jgi:hypothetical protein